MKPESSTTPRGDLTLVTAATAEIRVKSSRFLALLTPAADEEAAGLICDQVRQRHRDATHHCIAWRIGSPARERASDAGEPSGTAGRPMLMVLRGAELTDVVAMVVRWFGGVKLGKGGLARAYSEALRAAVDNAATIRRRAYRRMELELPYELLGPVKKVVNPPAVRLASQEYGEHVRMSLDVATDVWDEVSAALSDLGLASAGCSR